jgi:hypothetical protein
MRSLKNSKKLAFSLIELSVVILVIGTLVIGIAQGTRIIAESKLKTARSLTVSSPANSIANMILWVDSTSEKSFTSDIQNNSSVPVWYNINPQVSNSPANPFQNTGSSQPTYKTNIINGLPAVYFDGGDNLAFDGTALVSNPGYTVFMVEQRTAASGYVFGVDGGTRTGGFAIGYNSTNEFRDIHYYGGFSWVGVTVPSYTSPIARISASTFNGTQHCIYINGATSGCNGNGVPGFKTTFNIGSGDFSNYTGYVAEIIVFGRNLNNQERRSVEGYLSQKWNVRVS